MLRVIWIVLRSVVSAFRSRCQLVLENLALRQQLAAFKARGKPPRIRPADRAFWVVLRECHLRRVLRQDVRYHHDDRTHLGLAKETPSGRTVERRPSAGAKVVALPRVGGLHHPSRRNATRLDDDARVVFAYRAPGSAAKRR